MAGMPSERRNFRRSRQERIFVGLAAPSDCRTQPRYVCRDSPRESSNPSSFECCSGVRSVESTVYASRLALARHASANVHQFDQVLAPGLIALGITEKMCRFSAN